MGSYKDGSSRICLRYRSDSFLPLLRHHDVSGIPDRTASHAREQMLCPCSAAVIKEDHLEFSFSGLKSAFINLHHNAEQKGEILVKEDLCASFQAAVLDILLAKTKKALERYPVKTLVVAGGVAANQGLRERLAEEITDVGVVIPPLRLCGDNAGMIALAAAIECDQKHFAELDLNAKPSLAFAGFEE